MNRWIFGFALLAAMLPARFGHASERSEVLFSFGLVEFHAGRYEAAMDFFHEAVRADSGDLYARYYRGITRGRLGSYDDAVDDLRAVVSSDSTDGTLRDRAALELGVALIEGDRALEAVNVLDPLRRSSSVGKEATLFAGVAYMRAGNSDEARRRLLRARHVAEGDEALARAAQYYLGENEYRACHWSEARTHFTRLVDAGGDTPMHRQARGFLERIDAAGHPPYDLYASAGFEYDSNVALAPDDDAVKSVAGISDQDDARVVLSAGGDYHLLRGAPLDLTLGYEFYQSLHFDLSEFDLQNHRPKIELSAAAGPLQLGLGARYDFYLRKDDSFLQDVVVVPWVALPEGNRGRTEIFYAMRWRDFLEEPFDTLRDGFNHAVGLRQFLFLGARTRYLLGGYQYDHEDASHSSGDRFAYDGHELQVGAGWNFACSACDARAMAAQVTYSYRSEDYDRASGGRRDKEHFLQAIVRRGLTDHVGLRATYRTTFNDSDDRRFEYDRHVGSLAVEVYF